MLRSLVVIALKEIDEEEGALEIAMSEDQILVELWAMLSIEIDMEELSLEERLCNSMDEVEASHLFVTNFWIEADHLRMIKSLNKAKCVTNSWEIDIATGFVWLWFDSKLQVVTLIDNILTQDVEAFAVTLECSNGIFTCICLCAFAATPADIDLCAKVNREINIAHHFAQCISTDIAIIRCECTIFEDWV